VEAAARAANPGATVVKSELDNENGMLGYSIFSVLSVAQISIPSAINTAQRGDRYDHLGQKHCLGVELL
jgi:hypothetical protein